MPLDFQARYPGATLPEWAIFWALTTLGMKEHIDFGFQTAFAGGRTLYGGLVIDFEVYSRQTAISVLGIYWHYRRGAAVLEHDLLSKERYEQQRPGWSMVFIDEGDAIKNPRYYVREAFRGVDHSKLARGQ